jgi:hypothetical protein
VLELNPSTATVERLVREVAALDHDDAIEQSIVLERAFLVRTFWDEPHQWYARPWRQVVPQPMWQVLRPWFGHRAVSLIALMNEYQSVARRPWPGRLGTMAQITEPGPPRAIGSITGPYSAEIFRYQHGRTVGSIADRLALTRAASTLLALELYRRAHDNRLPDAMSGLVPEYLPAVPIDPYSGQEIRYRRDGERVMTYSVGRNRKDDGGEKLGEGPSRRWGIYREEQPPPDIGLMMRVSGGNK